MISTRIKICIAVAAFTLLLIENAYVAYKFYNWGQDNTQTLWDQSVGKNIDRKLAIKVKQDEIKNAPVDNAVTDRRLLNGSF